MKINVNQIDFRFENVGRNKANVERISHLIIDMLEEKLERDELKSQYNGVNFDKIMIPSITVDPSKTDYQIATACASAIYLEFIKQFQ